VSVTMVTKGTEVDLGTVDTLPADAVYRRGTAAITHYPLVLYPCASRGDGGGGGGGCMVVSQRECKHRWDIIVLGLPLI